MLEQYNVHVTLSNRIVRMKVSPGILSMCLAFGTIFLVGMEIKTLRSFEGRKAINSFLKGVIAIARRKMGLVLLHRRNWPNTEDTEVP